MDSIPGGQESFRSPDRWNSVPVPERVAQRALTNVDKQADGCWISRYSVMNTGYAQVGWGGTTRGTVLAHRAAWVAVNGQVPLGMTLDHTCKVKRCVNPSHLRPLPNYENARRTAGRDWPMGYCANGHDSTHLIQVTRNANTSGKATICGTCMKDSQARWSAANPRPKKQRAHKYQPRKAT
jgi:hypothetical protein